ncbi:MAG: molybdenum cofactor guanylyltransferase, partial [Gemmatimonadetes bacterium]
MSGPEGRFLGAVLVGGRSRRFGSPKARAALGGRPMAARAVEALAPWCGRVVAVTPDPARAEGLDLPIVADRIEGAGPLGGVHAALAEAVRGGEAAAIVLGCDLPLVDARVVGVLVEHWRGGVLVPEGPTGPEPLCGVYEAGLADEAAAALAAGERAARAFLERVDARV